MIQIILFEILFLIVRLISLFPMWLFDILGNILGALSYYLAKKRRNVGLINLSLCFPDMSYKQKKTIIKEHFKYLCEVALEYSLLFFGSYSKIRSIVKIKNVDILDKYYLKQPVILLAPHMVGLDLGGCRLSQDYVGCSMYSQQKSSYLTRKLHKARTRFMIGKPGGEIFARNDGLRPIIKNLKQHKQIFYYLLDQDFGERDSTYVPFFAHKECATVNILPRLVKLTNAVVIPMAVYKINNHYEIEFLNAWQNYPSEDLYNDIYKINQFVEYVVLKQVAQYFWLHKRFKTQPNKHRGILYTQSI